MMEMTVVMEMAVVMDMAMTFEMAMLHLVIGLSVSWLLATIDNSPGTPIICPSALSIDLVMCSL